MSDINESLFQQHLVIIKDEPPVDLLIWTSGERNRISTSFWQIAYAELCFLDVLWPILVKRFLSSGTAINNVIAVLAGHQAENLCLKNVLSATVNCFGIMCSCSYLPHFALSLRLCGDYLAFGMAHLPVLKLWRAFVSLHF